MANIVLLMSSNCEFPYSKSQINKAGDLLRADQLKEQISHDELDWAHHVATAFRAEHQSPLIKTTEGLQRICIEAGLQAEISQRLKRYPTILDELKRQPTLALCRLQDIGGCRAVFENMLDLRSAETLICNATSSLNVERKKDYINEPAESGYRSLHIIVNSEDRRIEIQLRTKVQHEWAFAVEKLGSRIDKDLKSGEGPKEVLEFLETASVVMAIEESGVDADKNLETLLTRLDILREQALPHIGGGTEK